ncbi:hypothetical protein NUW58_g7515 [Xylaria curta]|uniref:Uncharacterized protein n=1 Tax=Xylaria curta TaxID=42375 RepID=A0ACC1NHG2_9PEZI|nr:hypothetical protein NUW58_g7515 [Xylaria curta]
MMSITAGMGTQAIKPQVFVEQPAILQLLDITLNVVTWEESETVEMSQLVSNLCNRYRDYQKLQQNFLTKRPVLDELTDNHNDVTEADLKKLFSSDEYEEFKDHVQAVERTFQRLTHSIQLGPLNAKWTQRLLHPTKERVDGNNEVAGSYSGVIETLHTLDFSVQEEQNTKFIDETREVVEIFRTHLTKYGSKWEGFEPLKARVRMENPTDVRERLGTIDRDLKAMARLIKNRQLYLRPDFETQTYGVGWELRLDSASGHNINVGHPIESWILPERLSRYQLLVEARSMHNSRQQEVPIEDFGLNGKYRGVCKLFITCRAENFPGRLFQCEGSGWLLDDSTIVTAGHCVYRIERSSDRRMNYGLLRAVEIEVCIGYARGGASGSSNMESRKGKWVLTHHEWYDRQEKDCDIALIRLQDAFEHPRGFPHVNETPRRGENETIYVVGYPIDIPPHLRQTMPEDTTGHIMYESSRSVTWDLDNPDTGLTYRADTYAGNSGGPVLRYNQEGILEVIGVHVSGDEGTGINSATTLGHYGIHLPTFLDALNNVQNGAFANGRFRNDKVEGWPQVQILTLPYVTPL